MEDNKKLILGLDLGVASVGWALISEQGGENVFIDAGVKIFQSVREGSGEVKQKLKNQARREARGARRNLKRKVARKIALKNTLIRAGLSPVENFHKNIYELRTIALDKKVEKEDLFALLYHFGQKRGFLSNAKGKAKDDGDVKKSISSIAQNMELLGVRTLGEYRYFIMKHRKEHNLPSQKFEEKYTSRAMYRDELEKIWEKQSEFYPEILTKDLKNEIFYFIFYQRPLKLQKNLVGSCLYFPSRKRAEKASFVAQEFLVWKQVSDLKYKPKGSWNFEEISFSDKKKLVEVLMRQKTYDFSNAKKLLGLDEEGIFNLEKSKKKLGGNETNYYLEKFLNNSENFVGEHIFAPENADSDQIKKKLLQDMLTIHVDEYLIKRLQNFWKISEKGIQELLKIKINLPSDYVRYSEKAIKKILEVMQQTGENDRKVIEDLRKQGKFPKEHNVYGNMKNPWQELPVLRNPSVTKAIVEARKVIKAIKNIYGMPTLVRIEMASDLKNSKKERRNILKNQKLLEQQNDNARKKIAESDQTVTRERILLCRLWEECGGICPYTGKAIDLPRLIMGDSGFDVEHIIPYSRCLDDSFANKTLCYADFNRNIKKNKTPFELGQENPQQYAEIISRVKKHLPWKLKKFELQEVNLDDFILRQLNDTRYICQEVRKFCEALIGENNVEVTKGRLTSLLRKAWNFHNLLGEEGENELEQKKNRSDHRHHAIDAIVVALTGRNLLQKASIQSRDNELKFKEGDERMHNILRVYNHFAPSEKFRSDMQDRLDTMIISHTAVHKIRESLHEDTAYGKIFDAELKEERFVVRKGVETLDLKKLDNIVDKGVREILREYFQTHGKYSAENPPLHKDGKTPIQSVRMRENKSNMYNFRGEGEKFFVFGSNHHVEILKNMNTNKYIMSVVSMLEANRRAKNKESIINKNGPWVYLKNGKVLHASEWEFQFSLMIGDLFQRIDGQIFVSTGISGSPNDILDFRHHLNANGSGHDWRCSPNTLLGRKIQIDALGNISPAND